MTSFDATQLLRTGLLDGRSVLVVGDQPAESSSPAGAILTACRQLGALTHECALSAHELVDGAEPKVQEAVASALARLARIDLLVFDGAGLFFGAQPRDGLRVCLDTSWSVTRAVANGALLPEGDRRRGGRIVYVSPPANAGEHADGARAGLENLARTLSIEWARYAITTATIAPARVDADACAQLGALVAYLASPAGAYFSGCLLDLRGVAAARAA